jgi:ferric-dicitrate binding protein FerR (iron transport regulator)
MGRTHDEDDAPESVRRALRRLIEEGIQPGDEEAPELSAEFFGRADALDLIQEAVIEARLARAKGAGEASRSRSPSLHGASVPSRGRPAFVLHTGASGAGSGSSWRKMAIAAAAIIAVGVSSSVMALRVLRGSGDGSGAAEYRTASTGSAQIDTLELPDGSRAIVAPNTTVRYAIAAKRGARLVTLGGEAYFDVRHDERRPFRVQTTHATVTDLGTTFVVREYAADTNALVAVRSGAASVMATTSGGATPVTMHPGDGARVGARGEISRFTADPASYGSWTSGTLAFDAAQLPEVLDRLGRWYDVDFRLADTTLSTQYFTGEFRSASLADALAILGPIVHARFAQEGTVVVVTASPAGR